MCVCVLYKIPPTMPACIEIFYRIAWYKCVRTRTVNELFHGQIFWLWFLTKSAGNFHNLRATQIFKVDKC